MTAKKEPPFSSPAPVNNAPLTAVAPNVDEKGAMTAAEDAAALEDAAEPFGEAAVLNDLCTVQLNAGYWSYSALRPEERMSAFLASDLDVGRLNSIYNMLWWAGRQVPPRPLHRLKMLGRKITITEQADLHMVWSVESYFVKPLPGYLLDYSFWEQHICKEPHKQATYESARGFVLSYVWLIRYKSDFEIAKEAWLLPADLTWPKWRVFVQSVWDHFGDLNNPHSISDRYKYGELRISRLDQIYRFAPHHFPRHLLRGYLYSYSSYGGFFRREFAWLIVAFAYASIILAAMQLGLTTTQLRDDENFNQVSYGFAVTAIMFPGFMLAVAMVLYFGLWIYHVTITVIAWQGKRKKERQHSSDMLDNGSW